MLAIITFGLMPLNSPSAEVEVLIEKLKKAADPGRGITEEESKIARQLQAFGAEAVPPLLALLQDNNEQVRDVASYTLQDVEGLTEEHLPALVESHRRGNGWFPTAIARIGTPKAVEFLVAELVQEKQTNTQLTLAVSTLGAKAVPHMIQIYQSEAGWDDALKASMESVFKETGATATDAIDPLLKIVSDDMQPSSKRARAAAAVGAIGLSAERAVPELQKLRQHGDQEIRNVARSAILSIGSADAVPILVEDLAQMSGASDRKIVLRAIASLRARGNSAGPVVMKYLAEADWDVRVAAARTLGFVGCKEAAEELIKLLDRQDDWRLVFVAAESLGRLRAKQAEPALSGIGNSHWYPPVCAAVERALDMIREGSSIKVSDKDVLLNFFEYEDAREEIERLEPSEWTKTRAPVQPLANAPFTIKVRRKDGRMQREEHIGITIDGGYLIATDNGERGGALEFVDPGGNVQLIAQENTMAIYRVDDDIFAVTGPAHLSAKAGFIQKLRKSAGGQWTVEKWRTLPGAPRISWLLKTRKILVSCLGGIVLVSLNGEMELLTRKQALGSRL
jgi:HEAT repeat protein